MAKSRDLEAKLSTRWGEKKKIERACPSEKASAAAWTDEGQGSCDAGVLPGDVAGELQRSQVRGDFVL